MNYSNSYKSKQFFGLAVKLFTVIGYRYYIISNTLKSKIIFFNRLKVDLIIKCKLLFDYLWIKKVQF